MHNNPFQPTDRMLRQFAVLWILFFGGTAVWRGVGDNREVLAVVLGVLAFTIGPIGLLRPRLIRPVFIAWMTVASPIGWTVSRIVLGTVFYGFFTPLGVVFRIIGRDELGLKRKPEATTYWESKPIVTDKEQYLRQY